MSILLTGGEREIYPYGHKLLISLGSVSILSTGGEREIRTPDILRYAPFPRVCTRPLCDLSEYIRTSMMRRRREEIEARWVTPRTRSNGWERLPLCDLSKIRLCKLYRKEWKKQGKIDAMGLHALRRVPALSVKIPRAVGIFTAILIPYTPRKIKSHPDGWEFDFSGASNGTRTHNGRHGKAVL